MIYSFNPFIPTRGVGIQRLLVSIRNQSWFQSIYTYKRRWNTTNDLRITTILDGFNPFIPTRGVGIRINNGIGDPINMFQSIYTYKRRWNSDTVQRQAIFVLFQSIYTYKRRWNRTLPRHDQKHTDVSIHLYLQEALEYCSNARSFTIWLGFNPFIPTRGVGILQCYH